MSVSRRNFLKVAGALAGGTLMPTVGADAAAWEQMRAGPQGGTPQPITRSALALTRSRLLPITFFPPSPTTASFPAPCFVSRKASRLRSILYNDTTRRNNCTGMARWFPPTWMAPPRRARLSSPHMASGALFSRLVPSGFASITPTIGREPIFPPASTAGRWDRCTSSRGTNRELRPRNFPGPEGIRAHLQPRRRHGHGLSFAGHGPKALKQAGESAMKASLAKGMPHGYEVGYDSFTINGRMLGHGEPLRVKQGERVLFHILNGSATEIRSLALPGHSFRVVALDGNPVPNPATVPVLWLGTAERISAIVEMNHPGVWILGDSFDDDRQHGMGIVVEYAGRTGKPHWIAPPQFRWNYTRFAKARRQLPAAGRDFGDELFARTMPPTTVSIAGRSMERPSPWRMPWRRRISFEAGQALPLTCATPATTSIHPSAPPHLRADQLAGIPTRAS